MTVLAPMRPDVFDAFAEECIASYADDNVRAGRWPIETAHQRSEAAFRRLLPQGPATPGHLLFEIRDEGADETVGALWFAVVETVDDRHGYLYNIRVEPRHRGRGHATAALALLEEVARAAGLTSIWLHVFSFNTHAQALYRSIGYGITGMNMRKPLAPESR